MTESKNSANELRPAFFTPVPEGAEPDRQAIRKALLVASGIGAGVGVIAITLYMLLIAQTQYTAYIVVGPAESSSASGASSSLSGFASQLIGSVGLSLSSTDLNYFQEYQQALTSTEIGRKLLAVKGMPQKLLWKRWDNDSKTWKLSLVDRFQGLFAPPLSVTPTPSVIADYLTNELNITTNADMPAMTISLQLPDPKAALQAIQTIDASADQLIRERAQSRLAILRKSAEERLATATVSDYRDALISAIATYDKTLLLIDKRVSFAAKVLEPAVVENSATSPKPLIYLGLGAFAGAVFAAALQLFLGAHLQLWFAVARRYGQRLVDRARRRRQALYPAE